MRLPRRLAPVMLVGAVSWGTAIVAGGAQPPTLPGLLSAVSAYVASYEQQASAIVFEEVYVQGVTGLGARSTQVRRLRSDVAVINTRDLGWMGFRDVFEVDGKAVRDRQDRLQELLASPQTDAINRARIVADESARFNLGRVQRNLNYPTMALMFLRQAHQTRSTFSLDGSARGGRVPTWTIKFREVERPSLIGSRQDGAPGGDVVTSGRFWIEPDTGRVRRSQITVEEERATGTIDVEYGTAPGVDVLVPLSMEETFSIRGLTTAGDTRPIETIRGTAHYSNFRRFQGKARIKEVTVGGER